MLQRNLYVFSWEIEREREREVERPQSSRKKNHKFSGWVTHTTIVIQKIVYWFEIFLRNSLLCDHNKVSCLTKAFAKEAKNSFIEFTSVE